VKPCSKEGIEISGIKPEYGEARKISEKEYKGDPISIGLQLQLHARFLGAAADGPISIELKMNSPPARCVPSPRKHTAIDYIIMPMRI